MFTFRHYQSGDEKAIVELWNKTLKEDPITPKRFSHLVLLDANFDPVGLRLAFVKEKLIGVDCRYERYGCPTLGKAP